MWEKREQKKEKEQVKFSSTTQSLSNQAVKTYSMASHIQENHPEMKKRCCMGVRLAIKLIGFLDWF